MESYFTAGHEKATIEYLRSVILDAYDLAIKELTFVAHSDKYVCSLTTSEDHHFSVLVYLSRNGFDDEHYKYKRLESIEQEISFLQVIDRETDILVPNPLVNRKGKYLTPIDIPFAHQTTYLMIVSYISGKPMDPKEDADYLEKCYLAGQCAAKIHQVSRRYFSEFKANQRPVHRHGWVVQIKNDIQRGLNVGTISDEDFETICHGLDYIDQLMTKLDSIEGSRGFVHTDLRAANFINTGVGLAPIDFSRTVYGYLLYDLGEMCAHMGEEDVELAIIQGYTSITPLTEAEMHCIEGFFLLFVLSVVGEFILDVDREYVPITINRLVTEQLPNLLSQKPLFRTIRTCAQG